MSQNVAQLQNVDYICYHKKQTEYCLQVLKKQIKNKDTKKMTNANQITAKMIQKPKANSADLLQTLTDRVQYGDGTEVYKRLNAVGINITRYMVNRVLSGKNYRKDVWETFAELERERQQVIAAELQTIINKMQIA